MHWDWQNIAVAVVVAWAAWFMGRKFLPIGRKQNPESGCGTCGSCSAKPGEPPNLVPLETLQSPKP